MRFGSFKWRSPAGTSDTTECRIIDPRIESLSVSLACNRRVSQLQRSLGVKQFTPNPRFPSGARECTVGAPWRDCSTIMDTLRLLHRHRYSPGTVVGFGSNVAVPLTSGEGLLSGLKLKKHDQELTLGSKVGLLQESGHTPGRRRTAGCSQKQSPVLRALGHLSHREASHEFQSQDCPGVDGKIVPLDYTVSKLRILKVARKREF